MNRPALPRWKCHKEVDAVKIAAIEIGPRSESDGTGYFIVPADKTVQRFEISVDYFVKFSPRPGGYYVRYDDDYQSFSPALAFEEGYTKI